MSIRCQTHPGYSGQRAIRRMGDVCPQCKAIYDEVKKSGVKEKRNRKPKVAPVAVAPVPAASEPIPAPVVEPTVVPVPQTDEALPGGLGSDGFDVATGNLDEVL